MTIVLASCGPTARQRQTRFLAGTQIEMFYLGEAVAKYQDTKGKTLARPDGLLSWRVHLLPFLGEDSLYREFHLNEPWGSDNNIRLVPKIPPIYQAPNGDDRYADARASGKTCYLAVIGKNTAWGIPADHQNGGPTKWADNAVVVQVQPSNCVVWTKPGDWEYEPTDPLRGLYIHKDTELKEKEFYVLTRNGAAVGVPVGQEKPWYDQVFSRNPKQENKKPFGRMVTIEKVE